METVETLTACDGSVAEIRNRGNDWFLKIVSRETGHARWGTKAEIYDDAAIFTATGRLPVSGHAGGF